MMEVVAPFKEGSDMMKEEGGEAFKLCWQCGLCSSSCPWNIVSAFFPHKKICESKYGLIDLEEEDWWLCSTCHTCVSRCPRGVEIIDVIRAARRILLEFQYSKAPASLRNAMGNLSSQGNPWAWEQEKRGDWAKGLDVRTFTSENDLLYFPGCVPAYDTELVRIAQATASILKRTGANFGILGVEEHCCGESVRKAGNEDLFEKLSKSNIDAFKKNGVREIIVSSPHCYTTFKDEYPARGGDFKVFHFTQYLAKLIEEGTIKFDKQVNKKVVYHDPCYLGRHNGIYDEPRMVLASIPGLTLMDEVDSRENSLCCGGGGGRIWMETRKGERFSDILVEQAIGLGADILATACPYCLLNFRDSVLTEEKTDLLEIKSVAEIVNEAI
jgi:Fe-S oxidoreductase